MRKPLLDTENIAQSVHSLVGGPPLPTGLGPIPGLPSPTKKKRKKKATEKAAQGQLLDGLRAAISSQEIADLLESEADSPDDFDGVFDFGP